jgi:hypothetical protein
VHDPLSQFPSIKIFGFLLIDFPSGQCSLPDFIILFSPPSPTHFSPLIPHGSLSFHSRAPHPVIATPTISSNLTCHPFRPASYAPSHMLYFPTRLTLLSCPVSDVHLFPMRHFTYRITGHDPLAPSCIGNSTHLLLFLPRGHTISSFLSLCPFHFFHDSFASRLTKKYGENNQASH